MSIIKKGTLYLLIAFLPLIANFLVLPFFTVYLDPVEYGILAMSAVLQSYLTIAIGFGLPGAFSRFYYDYYKKKILVKSLLFTVFTALIVLTIIVALCLFFFGELLFSLILENENIVSFNKYGIIIWGLAASNTFYTIIQVFYRNEENLKMFSIISIAGFFLMLLGNLIGVIVLKLGAYGSLVGKLLGILLIIIPYFTYFCYSFKLQFRFGYIKPIFKFAFPLVPYLLLGVIINNLDKQLLEHYMGVESVGIYNVALMIGGVPSIFLTAAQSTVNPQIFKILNENSKNTIEVKNLIKILLLFVLAIVSLLISFINIITKYFIGNDYQIIVYFVPIIALAYCFRAFYVVLIIPLEFEKKSKYLPLTTIFSLCCVLIFGAPLINEFQIYGVCLLVVLIQITQVLSAAFFTYKMNWLNSGLYNQPLFFIGTIGLMLILAVHLYVSINHNIEFTAYLSLVFLFFLICYNYRKTIHKYLKWY